MSKNPVKPKTREAAIPIGIIDAQDELARIRARVRLLEVALLGGGSGMSFEDGTYLDALVQGIQDIAHGLDALDERLRPAAIAESEPR
jgi:hypothetical protein